MTTAKISKSTVLGYKMVKSEGKTPLKVRSVARVFDENLGKYKHIVNLRAIAKHNVAAIREIFSGVDEVAISELNGKLMSFNIIENEGQKTVIPAKGETVECVIGTFTRESGEKILIVEAYVIQPPVESEFFSFEDDEQLTPETEEEEETVKI